MKTKKRWVIKQEDLKTYERVRPIVGWVAAVIFLPIILITFIGAGLSWVGEKSQQWLNDHLLLQISAWIVAILHRMWKNRI